MAKKKILDRISEALGLYDPDEAVEAEEMEEEAAAEEEQKNFPSSRSIRSVTDTQEKEEASVPEAKASREQKKSLFSRVRKSKGGSRMIQMTATTEIKVVVMEPTSFDDSPKVADYLRGDQPVVVNFERTDPMIRKRLTDFIGGTIYALNGSIRSIGPNILVCAPRNVDIDAEAELYSGERRDSSWPRN